MECPEGWQFGRDWEEKDECAECNVFTWTDCAGEWSLGMYGRAFRLRLINRNFDKVLA